jgi:hypothetical protein
MHSLDGPERYHPVSQFNAKGDYASLIQNPVHDPAASAHHTDLPFESLPYKPKQPSIIFG